MKQQVVRTTFSAILKPKAVLFFEEISTIIHEIIFNTTQNISTVVDETKESRKLHLPW